MPVAVLFGTGDRSAAPAMPAEPIADHTHGIDAFGMILEGEISRLDFARALGALARERGTDLLRVKGIVRFSDRPERPAVVQAAQHAMFAPEWLDAWPDEDRRSRLVFVVTKSREAKSYSISPSRHRCYGVLLRDHPVLNERRSMPPGITTPTHYGRRRASPRGTPSATSEIVRPA